MVEEDYTRQFHMFLHDTHFVFICLGTNLASFFFFVYFVIIWNGNKETCLHLTEKTYGFVDLFVFRFSIGLFCLFA